MNTKKLLGTLITAFLGALIALFVYTIVLGKKEKVYISENTQPAKFTSYRVPAPSDGMDFVYAAEKTVQAVVHVKTQSKGEEQGTMDPFYNFFFGDRDYKKESQPVMGFGSGVIVTSDGYIATNNHVIEKADIITVVLNDKRSYNAKLVGSDPSTDIALLKIDEKELPFIAYGNSDAIKVGEWVLAVGNPFNLTSTVTAGIVSAKARNINLLKDKYAIESFIQTDVAVNPGNSGGALVNMQGELIGITNAIMTPTGAYSGTSFAVPVNIAKKVISDLIEFGKIQRAILGVSIKDVNSDLIKDKHLDKIQGVYVDGISAGSAADKAGIKEGDVILKIGDMVVNNPSELQEQISMHRPNEKVSLTISREGKTKQIDVVLRNMEGDGKIIKKEELVSSLGASFQPLSDNEKQNLRINNGVKVTGLTSGKLKKAGLEEGFIITNINNKPVNSVDDIKRIINGIKGGVYIEGIYPNGVIAYYAFGM
jgi:serine protease Do